MVGSIGRKECQRILPKHRQSRPYGQGLEVDMLKLPNRASTFMLFESGGMKDQGPF
jgi:hypothetical protein